MLFGALLLLQSFGMPAHTISVDVPDHLGLITDNGTYTIELGPGCDDMTADLDVIWLAGNGDVGQIQRLDSDTLCNVYIDGEIDADN